VEGYPGDGRRIPYTINKDYIACYYFIYVEIIIYYVVLSPPMFSSTTNTAVIYPSPPEFATAGLDLGMIAESRNTTPF